MYAKLGNVAFDLVAYWDGHDAKRAYDYAEHKVIEGKPKLQWTGDGLEELEIAVSLHALFCKPEEQLATLHDAAARHVAMPLTMGSGRYLGRYVLTGIHQTTKQTDPEGRVLALTARLTLKEHNGDTKQPSGDAVAAKGQNVPGSVRTTFGQTPAMPDLGSFSWLQNFVRYPA